MQVCPKSVCISTVGVRKDLFHRNPDQVPITDFFGSVRPVNLVTHVEQQNVSEKSSEKVQLKPKRYKYVPALLSYNGVKQ